MQAKKIKGNLFIISAPSGTGKTTLCKKLISSLGDLRFSISYTTRQPRAGEINNKDYTFVSREDFYAMVDKKEFIEWAEVHGELYGSSKKRIEDILNSGADVILDIDTQGAMQLKERTGEGIYVFILPPSMDALRERLKKRMADSSEEITKRLERAVSEIKTYQEYDYVIINEVLDNALKELEAIIISHRSSSKRIDPVWIEETFLKKEAV